MKNKYDMDEVLRGYVMVQRSGITNMMDFKMVAFWASKVECIETYRFFTYEDAFTKISFLGRYNFQAIELSEEDEDWVERLRNAKFVAVL